MKYQNKFDRITKKYSTGTSYFDDYENKEISAEEYDPTNPDHSMNLVLSEKGQKKLDRLDARKAKKAAGADVFGLMKDKKTEKVLSGASQLTQGINSSLQNYTGTQQALNSGIHSAMQAMGP